MGPTSALPLWKHAQNRSFLKPKQGLLSRCYLKKLGSRMCCCGEVGGGICRFTSDLFLGQLGAHAPALSQLLLSYVLVWRSNFSSVQFCAPSLSACAKFFSEFRQFVATTGRAAFQFNVVAQPAFSLRLYL
jgi:hypothetical protein